MVSFGFRHENFFASSTKEAFHEECHLWNSVGLKQHLSSLCSGLGNRMADLMGEVWERYGEDKSMSLTSNSLRIETTHQHHKRLYMCIVRHRNAIAEVLRSEGQLNLITAPKR